MAMLLSFKISLNNKKKFLQCMPAINSRHMTFLIRFTSGPIINSYTVKSFIVKPEWVIILEVYIKQNVRKK